MKKKVICIFIIIVGLFSSCGINMSSYPFQKINLDKNEIFLYDPLNEEMGIYNNETKIWKGNVGLWISGFDFGNANNYFAYYDDTENRYLVLNINESDVDIVYKSPIGYRVKPLCSNEKYNLFVLSKMDESNNQGIIISIKKEEKEEIVLEYNDMNIVDGVLINDSLYILDYDSDLFCSKVCKFDLSTDNPNKSIIVLEENYNYFHLYRYKDNVLLLDEDLSKIYNKDCSILLNTHYDQLMIDSDANLMYEFGNTSNNMTKLIITDLITREKIGTYRNVINFIRRGNKISIYKNGTVEVLDISTTRNNSNT